MTVDCGIHVLQSGGHESEHMVHGCSMVIVLASELTQITGSLCDSGACCSIKPWQQTCWAYTSLFMRIQCDGPIREESSTMLVSMTMPASCFSCAVAQRQFACHMARCRVFGQRTCSTVFCKGPGCPCCKDAAPCSGTGAWYSAGPCSCKV